MSQNWRSRTWCFTLNNYTEDEEVYMMNLTTLYPEEVQYLIFGEEHTAGEGTPHLQGYIEFYSRKRFGSVKEILTERAHIETRQGPQHDAIEYCKKEGHYYEYGTPILEAGYNQWDFIKNQIALGNTMAIWDKYPKTYMTFRKTIEEMAVANQPQLTWDGDLKAKNQWIWGPAGIGKSKKVREIADAFGHQIYPKNCNKWWDGYKGEHIVVLEDLDPERAKMLAQHIKVWADRYGFIAEVKGGAMRINPTFNLFITSNYSPEACFQNQEDLEAVRRRFTVVHMTALG